jgi:hypothetical protein
MRRPVAVVASKLSCRLTKATFFFSNTLHQPIKVCHATGKRIELVDDHRAHLPGFYHR